MNAIFGTTLILLIVIGNKTVNPKPIPERKEGLNMILFYKIVAHLISIVISFIEIWDNMNRNNNENMYIRNWLNTLKSLFIIFFHFYHLIYL